MKSIPELSTDTKLLYERLKLLQPNEVVTYDELSQIVGRDVRKQSRSNLTSAVRRCGNEDNIVIDTVINVGVKRATDQMIIKKTEKVRSHMSRTVTRHMKRVQCADYNALSRQDQTEHNTALAWAGLVAHISKVAALKKIEGE